MVWNRFQLLQKQNNIYLSAIKYSKKGKKYYLDDNNLCQKIVRYYMPRDKIKALTYANKLIFDLSGK